MREMHLSRGKISLVDDEDYDHINQWKWSAYLDGNTWYASRMVSKNPNITVKLHRIIMNAPENLLVDHIDGNGLHNYKENLRICDFVGNSRNRSRNLSNTSGYKGVYWNSQKKKFRARISFNGKIISIGYFTDAEEAARAWDKYAEIYHGEYARLNFPRYENV